MPTTDAERFARLDQLFQAALDEPPETRESWLASQTDDPELLAEVTALLAEDAAQADSHLESIVDAGWRDAAQPNGSSDPAANPFDLANPFGSDAPTAPYSSVDREAIAATSDPEQVGPYRILGRLGRGGLATVYLAERTSEFSMPVALKRIRRGMDTEDILERLRLERQILARLVHPNIARIHDGGSDEEGRPYLVMEVIEGEHVDQWCASHALPVRQRLELFNQACEAVDFAHQNLILHRDLKPSNILVTSDGTVKLLDFGIAKVLAGDSAGEELGSAQPTATGVEHRLLTPDYASPEQMLGLPLTTSSDVYSLGVVLYKLISGRLPHSDLPPLLLMAGERRDPPLVSRAARDQRAAGNRLTAQADRWSATRGEELDAIVAKALEAAPAQRYGSVRELADDIDRLLEDRPVLARRPSWRYRLVKLARRHRLGVALGTLIALSLLIGIIGTSWQATVASAERQRAEQQRAQAETVVDFLVDLFEVSDPYSEATLLGDLGELARPRGETVTARELLDSAAERISTGMGGDWARRSRLRRAIGRAYFNLSLHDQAREQLEAAAKELAQVDRGQVNASLLDLESASVTRDLGWLEARQGLFDLAEEHLQSAEARLKALGTGALAERALALEHLGELDLLRKDTDAASEHYQAALALNQQLFGDDSLVLARARAGLAQVRARQGSFAEMTALLEQALEVRRNLLGEQHPLVLETLNDLAVASLNAGDYEAARVRFADLLEGQKQVLGKNHADLLPTYYNLAFTLHELRQPAEAEALLAQAFELAEDSAVSKTPIATEILLLQGLLRDEKGDLEGAAAVYQQGLALRRHLFGTQNEATFRALMRLGRLWARAGDSRAEPLLREALEVSQSMNLDQEASVYLALGELALAGDDAVTAESELRRGLAAQGGQGGWMAGILELRLAKALSQLDRKGQALESAQRAVGLLREGLPKNHSWTLEAERLVDELKPGS